MNISAGLVGLPNVGKSTLFNALTRSSVPAENYPFCTIDPHLACTTVPDERELKLKALYKSEKIIPSTVQFVDIAGLVKGAASGEGLGNQFLAHIREVDLILHVLRCFEDTKITRIDEIDPVADFEVINTELMLKDIESVEKRLAKVAQSMKKSKGPELKEFQDEHALLTEVAKVLEKQDSQEVQRLIESSKIKTIPLLCAKNFLIIANVAEGELAHEGYEDNPHYQALVKRFGKDRVIPVSARLEGELSQLNEEEQQEMRSMLDVHYDGLAEIIKQSYKHLGLITFFTCGPKEIHAWPIKKGLTIRQAGGEIHTDLEKGFIAAEVFQCNDLFQAGSIAKLKELGKVRTEGQDYLVQDGDIVLIRFNV